MSGRETSGGRPGGRRRSLGRARKLRGLLELLAPYRWRVVAMIVALVSATAAAADTAVMLDVSVAVMLILPVVASSARPVSVPAPTARPPS